MQSTSGQKYMQTIQEQQQQARELHLKFKFRNNRKADARRNPNIKFNIGDLVTYE